MRLSLSAAAITITGVQAFKDTSPFLLFSSASLPSSLNDASVSQLQSRAQVLDYAKKFIGECPSDVYYVITQPSLSSTELSSYAPHLRKAIYSEDVATRFLVGEALGLKLSDGDDLVRYLEKTCGAKRTQRFAIGDALKEREVGGSVIVRDIYDTSRIFEEKMDQLQETDSLLHGQVLKELPNGYRYTIIYTTTASTSNSTDTQPLYQAAFNEAVHMDLKRNLQERDHTYPAGEDVRPLFEKYQFLNPGLFMGILVTLILLSILSVGISAVSSLEVSYGAFEREMGPASQKK